MRIPQIICAGLACASLGAYAQDRTAHAWGQVETVQINREEPRAFFVPHFTTENASKILSVDDVDKIYDTESAKILNGKWRFFFAQNPEDVEPDFFKKSFDDKKWDMIDVPCSWQARGYDKVFYNNTGSQMFFKEDGGWLPQFQMKNGGPSDFALNPKVPEMHRQRGIYRTAFSIPQSWNGKEVFIRFNGVRTGYNLYVNGEFAGYSEDSFTPGEFNITKLLQKGENSLAVEVFKHTTGAASELQDMPQVMGITRDVVLLARSPLHIRDYYAPISLSEDLKSAKIAFDIDIRNLSPKMAEGTKLDAFLVDAQNGKRIPLFSKGIAKTEAKTSSSVKEEVKLDSFKLWSPDAPNYYQLVMELKDSSGKPLETIAADFGFARFDWKNEDNQFFLNKIPYLIKGVNHHDWSPDKGKTMDFAWMKKDFELIKGANMNSVRTSHYPKDDKFYMLATRYGIALMDENNYETHSLWDQIPGQLDNWVPQALFKMKNMVVRDRNIPSVIMFSTNNESSPHGKIGKALMEMEKLSRRLDPTRPVHSESAIGDPDNNADFESPMYGNIGRMNAYLRKEGEKKPFFFCEYTHAMGNAMGNFKETWDLMRKEKSLNGGYIWDWVDQGLYLPREDKPGEKFVSDGRDWGTQPSARNFSHNGVVFTDRTYGVKYHETFVVYQDIQIGATDADAGKITISNEFISTNVSSFAANASVMRDGEKIAEAALPAFNVAPGESKEFTIKLPNFDGTKKGRYDLEIVFTRKDDTLFAKKGDLVARAQFKLKSDESFGELPVPNAKVTLSKKGNDATVKSGNAELKFANGDLVSYKIGGVEMLSEPMTFDISSAWIDNTRGGDQSELKDYEVYSMPEKSAEVTAVQTLPGCVEIRSKKVFANSEGDGYSREISYRVIGGGAFQFAGYMRKINDLPETLPLPRVGVKMRLSSELSNVEYLGRGPLMNYVDRKTSQFFGRYRMNVADYIENYSWPQDQGNREEVRWAAFTDKKGNGLMFSASDSPLPFAWMPNTQQEVLDARHPHNLPQSKGAELRIAHYVRGLGNNSCGPGPMREYSNFFKGEVFWKFHVVPFGSTTKPDTLGNLSWPEKFCESRAPETENLTDESLMKNPSGEWISEHASVTYSSRDEQWAPKEDTLLSEMRGHMSFHTKDEHRPWLVIDLGETKEIQGATIINRPDRGLHSRAHPLEMFVSDDNQNWKKVWRSKGARGEWKVVLDTPQKARYVKLQVEKKSSFHLKGVKIFGKNK